MQRFITIFAHTARGPVEIQINQLTGHVQIKGNFALQYEISTVKDFASDPPRYPLTISVNPVFHQANMPGRLQINIDHGDSADSQPLEVSARIMNAADFSTTEICRFPNRHPTESRGRVVTVREENLPSK